MSSSSSPLLKVAPALKMFTLFVLVVLVMLSSSTAAAVASSDEILELTPKEIYDGIQNNLFDAIIDVRREDEWEGGHIPDATWIPNLQLLADDIPTELVGCKCGNKTIVVYCKSGGRSAAAIELLKKKGFDGDGTTIYNGMGVVQWTDAGYDLVSTDSQSPVGCNEECPDEESNDNNAMTSMSSSSDDTSSSSSMSIIGSSTRGIIPMVVATIIVAIIAA